MLDDQLPPMRPYGQDYGPFTMATEAGFALGGALVESAVANGEASSFDAGAGAFYYKYDATPVATTYHYLQGGTVTGGTGTETLADLQLAEDGSEPADGWVSYLTVTGDGVVEDEVMLPGFNITAVSVTVTNAAALPDDEALSPDDYEGKKCYISLGTWTGGVFYPSDAGNIYVTHCLGGFRKYRE
jgi:hypothetical protein